MEGKNLALAVSMTGAVAIALGMGLLFGFGPPPAPDRPKPPPPSESQASIAARYSRSQYKAMIEQDAKAFRVPAPTLEQMGQPNPYFEELKGKRRVRAGDPLDTPHVRLVLEVNRMKAITQGQSFGSDHMLLRIENKTGKYLAYRIETVVNEADKCASKGDIAHSAIVLRPNQTITRSECLYRGDATVDVTHIEVIELPALQAFYASRLPATTVLYDARTSAGHEPLSGAVCPQTFSWREIREGLDGREIGWRDVIDFYARHNCDEYSFFRAYRYRSDPGAPLPVRPLD